MKTLSVFLFLFIGVLVHGQTLADTSLKANVEKIPYPYFSKQRVTAIALILLTGPLGGHRIYLGTHPRVPVLYAITLGGGLGLLPIIDLFMVLLNKDFSLFQENPNVFTFNQK